MWMPTFLDFEKPIQELEGKIEELRHLSDGGGLNIADEVLRLQDKVERLLKTTYAKLTPWQKVQVARHPERPHALDYLEALFTDYQPLAGDRAYAEDAAVVVPAGSQATQLRAAALSPPLSACRYCESKYSSH